MQWRQVRKILSSLAAGAALLGAGYDFEANATMGVAFQGLKQSASQFSSREGQLHGPRVVLPNGRFLACDPVCICVSCIGHPNSPKHHKVAVASGGRAWEAAGAEGLDLGE